MTRLPPLAALATVLGLALAAPAAQAKDDWIKVASTDADEWYILAGSMELRTNRSGVEVAVVVSKNDDRRARTITLEKLYVRTTDCQRRQGKGVVLTMDGDFKYDYDFVFGAGSVGAARAEAVCYAYSLTARERDGKGI